MTRRVHLVTLGVFLADVVVALANFADTDTPGASAWGDAGAITATVAAVLILTGWTTDMPSLAADGLAVSAALWAYLAVLYLLVAGPQHPGGWLALGWALVASGHYLTARPRGRRAW